MADSKLINGSDSNTIVEEPSEALPTHAKLWELAEERGVKPLTSDELRALGDLWPEDESVDEFLAAVQAQRRDSASRSLP